MIVAVVETYHFQFVTVAATRDAAEAALLAAWGRHRADYRSASPDYMAELINEGSVQFLNLELDEVARDGEVLR